MPEPAAKAAGFKLWYYNPSIPGNIIFAILFLVLTTSHLVMLIRTRNLFCIPIVVGGFFEVVGYIIRTAAHYHHHSTLIYAIQSLLILLAPILFAASAYMFLGRIIRSTSAERHSMIPLRFLTKIFVGGDILCFLVQAGGGGILASAKDTKKFQLGENVVLGGLILQIIVFCFFVAVAGAFHIRARKDSALSSIGGGMNWQQQLLQLYGVSVLIATRNIVRAIEYAQGSKGYLLTHEWTMFVFDAMLMLVVMSIAVFWHGDSNLLWRLRRGNGSHRLQEIDKTSP